MFRSKRIRSNYGNDQGQRTGQGAGQGTCQRTGIGQGTSQGASQGTSQGTGQGTNQGTGQGTSVAYTVTSDELNNSNASQMNFGENSSNDNGNEACINGGGSRKNAKRKKRSILVNGNSSTDEAQDWSDDVNFDEREDVRAIDSEGNVQLWSGSIQPHDVWFLEKGVRFEVTFNGFCQPIRKGGSIIVKFISSIAKKDDICPIRDVNWRNVNKTILGDIVNLIREKIIIPDGKIYDDAMLKHVGKHRRQWKFELKAKYFNPTVRTRTQIENDRPGGIVRENWLPLVEYWFSNKSKNYSEIGREARASLGHLHTNGATCFANSRDEFEIEHGREPGAYEFFYKTHQPKNGCYPNNTNTGEFIDMAKKKRIDSSAANSSTPKPQEVIENEVFNDLMYDKDKKNQRPLGYGFGMNHKDVFGVHALLRKKRGTSYNSSNDQIMKADFARYKRHTTDLLLRLTTQMTNVLDAVRSGNVSNEMLYATSTALRSIHAQNMEESNADDDEDDLDLST